MLGEGEGEVQAKRPSIRGLERYLHLLVPELFDWGIQSWFSPVTLDLRSDFRRGFGHRFWFDTPVFDGFRRFWDCRVRWLSFNSHQ